VNVVAELVDPDSRRVVLDDAGWTHVLIEHAEMSANRDAVLATVTEPSIADPIHDHCANASGGAVWARVVGCWWS
jgi:hypothetical protein